MQNAVGQRLRCPKCGKLLSVAHLPPGSWLEMVCKSCKLAVIFEPGRDPVLLPRHGQPEETQTKSNFSASEAEPWPAQ